MSQQQQQLDELSPEEQKKLKELMEKDAKTERKLSGPWAWLTAALAAAMVALYFYGAGVSALSTQYHLGIYVLITFVLVFLLYPAGGRSAHAGLSVVSAALLALLAGCFIIYDSPTALYQQITLFRETWEYDGLGVALEQDLDRLHYVLALIVPFAALMLPLDQWLSQRNSNSPTASDVVLALMVAGTVLYWISQFEALNYRAGAENEVDMLVSVVGLLLSLEICRRVLGWSITLIGIGMIAFALFGPYLPELFAHRGFRFERLATALFLTTNGVFGVMASVLATYVILFIFFGAFLQKSGAGKFFIDLPLAMAGRSTGGPAKVAVISSALFGSVSGSAIANTVSSGAFTIPMMKRAGFKPHVAGAIEPAASIGGMFLPPIMGAGGFLMAELTGTPYSTIMILSIGPAILYFLAVYCMVHFEAKKHGLVGIQGEEIPHWKTVFKNGWYYALPLVIITVLLLAGRSAGNSAFWATLSCIAVSWVSKETRMGPREIWEAIQTGARNTLIVGATIGVIGVIVGTISLTGMGLKFSDLIISMAGDSLLLALVLVAIASLVLGMGVPVTAAYLIVAVLAVPALGEFGVSAIAAHMIVYWLSQDSNITPPVCVAAYAGAAIAGSDPWKTGWTSFKFAKMLYVMPLLFAYVPAMLLDGTLLEIMTAFVSATLGTLAFGAFAMGYLRRKTRLHEWLLLGVGTLLLYWPSLLSDVAGLALVALVWWLQREDSPRSAVNHSNAR
ncbi:TRAP transporter permease [Oceanimonas baumannii]|uniref:C4-dicarboxylate ABC transporter permease n=1 Tax=Oceanimonas baumannii TaxID=129578 RepID=A0A235CFT0_9GAMM|nr:TRAP transporter permease [Oceanimonas baumannii]MCC4265264.1 TRAP transporter permease [Oceanimonas baumannii]OYD23316.1 C4-dicarboxylate ABC transporter permease [Oceanimonas baumannii]TDW58537.1 TRAP transporter 4TM/12TM fusion protein [Oceanimonas baumannii]